MLTEASWLLPHQILPLAAPLGNRGLIEFACLTAQILEAKNGSVKRGSSHLSEPIQGQRSFHLLHFTLFRKPPGTTTPPETTRCLSVHTHRRRARSVSFDAHRTKHEHKPPRSVRLYLSSCKISPTLPWTRKATCTKKSETSACTRTSCPPLCPSPRPCLTPDPQIKGGGGDHQHGLRFVQKKSCQLPGLFHAHCRS